MVCGAEFFAAPLLACWEDVAYFRACVVAVTFFCFVADKDSHLVLVFFITVFLVSSED